MDWEIGNTHKNRTSPKDSIVRDSKNTEKKLWKLKPLGPYRLLVAASFQGKIWPASEQSCERYDDNNDDDDNNNNNDDYDYDDYDNNNNIIIIWQKLGDKSES